jgi:PAS domain S-box-containing protein
MLAETVDEPLWQLAEEVRDHAIVLLDPHGNVASWHDGARTITGHAAREIIGTHFSGLYPPEAVALGCPELELKIAAVDGRLEGNGWRLRRNGSKVWVHVALMALRDRDGELRGFGQVIRDPGYVDGTHVQRGMREVDAPSKVELDRHFVKPLYWAALHQLLSALALETAPLTRSRFN